MISEYHHMIIYLLFDNFIYSLTIEKDSIKILFIYKKLKSKLF